MRLFIFVFLILIALGGAATSEATAAVQVKISLASQHECDGRRGALCNMGDFNGKGRIRHTCRDLPTAIAASISSVEPIQLGADATFDFLLSRYRNSRDVGGSQSRPARVSRLHPARSAEREDAVRIGEPSRDEQYQYYGQLLLKTRRHAAGPTGRI